MTTLFSFASKRVALNVHFSCTEKFGLLIQKGICNRSPSVWCLSNISTASSEDNHTAVLINLAMHTLWILPSASIFNCGALCFVGSNDTSYNRAHMEMCTFPKHGAFMNLHLTRTLILIISASSGSIQSFCNKSFFFSDHQKPRLLPSKLQSIHIITEC